MSKQTADAILPNIIHLTQSHFTCPTHDALLIVHRKHGSLSNNLGITLYSFRTQILKKPADTICNKKDAKHNNNVWNRRNTKYNNNNRAAKYRLHGHNMTGQQNWNINKLTKTTTATGEQRNWCAAPNNNLLFIMRLYFICLCLSYQFFCYFIK